MHTPVLKKSTWRRARSQRLPSPTSVPTTRTKPSSDTEEHRRSIPRLFLRRISARSPKRSTVSLNRDQSGTSEDFSSSEETRRQNSSLLVIRKVPSVVVGGSMTNSSNSRNFQTYSQSNQSVHTTTSFRKKPTLTRAKAIDESSIHQNLQPRKFSGDLRPHLLVSFFTKHFGKMPKKKAKRPLGMSLSCDLGECHQILRLNHPSFLQDPDILYTQTASIYLNQLQFDLNCFHCLLDIAIREREENTRQLSSTVTNRIPLIPSRSLESSSMKISKCGGYVDVSHNRCYNQNNTASFDNSYSRSYDVGVSPSVESSPLSCGPTISAPPNGHHFLPSSFSSAHKFNVSNSSLAKRHNDTSLHNHLNRTESLNSLKNEKNADIIELSPSASSGLPSTSSSSQLSISAENDDHGRALAKSPAAKRVVAAAAAAQTFQSHETSTSTCKHRTKNYWLDPKIHSDEHIWLPSSGPGTVVSSSRDTECYIGERDCRKIGEKQSCAACHIVAHTACLPLLHQLHMKCKVTYQEGNTIKKQLGNQLVSGSSKSETLSRHHWVHKWKHEGRCLHCGKSFQQKIFREKEVIAVTCSWCKRSYHNKVGCFSSHSFEELCDRGDLKEVIIPPTWILCSVSTRRRDKKEAEKSRTCRMFTVRPVPLPENMCCPSQPLLVFVNPKSGGNKGSKLLNTFCWLLNPRQVFDINVLKGPEFGLGMFKKLASTLRILVCGGDGTVGWVLSSLDRMNWSEYPPIGIVPLGTGNDLARCLGWGGSFSDEPLLQLLSAVIYETSITHLDRWSIKVEANLPSPGVQADEIEKAAQKMLPLNVMNNYYSIGADAHVALQFHHSRSANPQMLNSRFKNRIAYGGLGTIDLFKRTWKLLHEYITLECDGIDLTSKIKEFKFHCILFHNITYYAGGTVPWSSDNEDSFRPSSCDGKLEVLGFTTATLAALQMGGKGERIAQCSHARIKTTKAIPMQVDGEPCLLAPSTIEISFHSQVPMLRREKKTNYTPIILRKQPKISKQQQSISSQLPSTPISYSLPVLLTSSNDFHANRDHLEQLKAAAIEIGTINVEAEAELEIVRQRIGRLLTDFSNMNLEVQSDWRFLDYVSSAEEGIFRVPRHQEQFSVLSDICCLDDCIAILDNSFVKQFQHGSKNASKELKKNISFDDVCINGDTLHISFRSDTQEAHL